MTKTSRTREVAEKTIYAAFQILKENGNELPGRDVIEGVAKRVELDEWAKERLEKTGNIRWRSILHFYTIDCSKAGFLTKRSGTWYLTPEGEEAMSLGEQGLLDEAVHRYRKWRKEKNKEIEGLDEGDINEEAQEVAISLEQIEEQALDGLKEHIFSLNPYEFQDLAAALLRGMGYFTPNVAPRGKDGGIDITAYSDPLGIGSPRIKAQVKHRKNTTTTVQEVRQLMGLLQKDGDIGIFISTGGFTPDAKQFSRDANIHLELIDLPRMINLWQDFYDKLKDEDKQLMPLKRLYLLAPTE